MIQKQKQPKVSVIIPTFNRAWIVLEAVESVLTQDYRNFELIVVDDGSTDNTFDRLAKYNDHLTIIRKENGGVSAARNMGIRSSKGKYIAFLDSDDIWQPGKLATQVDILESNSDLLICQTEEIWIRNGRRVNPKRRHQKPSGWIFDRSLELCLVSPSAVMMDRCIFDDVGLFDESLPACEDYDLWLRISHRYPVHLIDTPLIIKRGGHDDQLSKSPSLDKYRIKALKGVIDTGSLSSEQVKAAVQVFMAKCRVYAGGCLKRGRKEEGQYYLNLIEEYKPRL